MQRFGVLLSRHWLKTDGVNTSERVFKHEKVLGFSSISQFLFKVILQCKLSKTLEKSELKKKVSIAWAVPPLGSVTESSVIILSIIKQS